MKLWPKWRKLTFGTDAQMKREETNEDINQLKLAVSIHHSCNVCYKSVIRNVPSLTVLMLKSISLHLGLKLN